MKWLVRSSRDTICWCDCIDSDAIASPVGWGQLDCPWCGCGYLFSCATCGKAFTYARCVDIPLSAEKLVRRVHKSVFGEDCPDNKLAIYVGEVVARSEPLVLDVEYVVLDGKTLDVKEGAAFVGQFAKHKLAVLPHALFRGNKGALVAALERPYWLANEKESRHG